MFTSSEVDWGRKDTSEQEIVYCLRLTEQRQYSYVIRFLNAAIEFCAVVIEEKKKQNKTQADHHEVNLIELQCNLTVI
jgi:LEA14-like dessication related protein